VITSDPVGSSTEDISPQPPAKQSAESEKIPTINSQYTINDEDVALPATEMQLTE